MRHLTIRQPWAGLIALGHKDVENRTWRPPVELIGDRIAVHAGRWDDIDDVRAESIALAVELGLTLEEPELHRHGIVLCTVQLARVTAQSESPWAVDGWWHWELDAPRAVRNARHVRGHTGLWTP